MNESAGPVLAGPALMTNDERNSTPVLTTTQDSKRDTQVPAAPVRAHVETLIAAGLTPALVAQLAGVETRRITVLLGQFTERGTKRLDSDRHKHHMYRRIAEPILAVPVPESMFTRATGPVRRLRALVRIGYPFAVLAGVLGYDDTLLRELALGEPEVIDAELADLVADLFERWHVTPGPCEETREFGRRHRFAAPLAWAVDDDDEAGSIDDPTAIPVGLPPTATRGVPADFAEIVADHRDLGRYDEEIAAALGVSTNTLAKRLHRAGISERRRGDGTHIARPPLYGARYALRVPSRSGVRTHWQRRQGIAS
ncbi:MULTISPECIES: hypothetical protein [unclassified Mycobacterium]|uniref:hypothetical protein n=1 Tax=unclassified Mycobacterium TaxID=2642494 RepID=UPI0029C84EEE|nr:MULTISPECIES: hypothetical protein [unclassified Mycobacterium]